MSSLNNSQGKTDSSTMPAVFGLAFRPLFLAGSLFSVIAITWWTYFWSAPFEWTPYGGATWWHAHEMLFGFGIAIITGFLLTAVRAWTGVPGLTGWKLISLFVLWLIGRIVISIEIGFNGWLIASIDISYLIAAAIAMAYPIVKVKQWRNIMFVPILLILATLNGVSHWAVFSNRYDITIQSFHATIILFSLIIIIIGGRVIPMFTANGAGCMKALPIKLVEALSILPMLILVGIALYGFKNANLSLLISILVVATLFNTIRFARWGIQATWQYPLLWSLHLSYLFIPIGLIALLLFATGIIDNLSAGLHCLTIGAIGGMILSMISRVSLGHTGRPLKPHAAMSIAYAAILFSASARFIFPIWLPDAYIAGIGISGFFWILGFTLFLIIYSPILISARADNKPS